MHLTKWLYSTLKDFLKSRKGKKREETAFCFPVQPQAGSSRWEYSLLSSQPFCSGDKRTTWLNSKWTLIFLATKSSLPTLITKNSLGVCSPSEGPGNSSPPLHRAPAAAGQVLLLLLLELQMVWLFLRKSKDQIQRCLHFNFQSLHEPVKLKMESVIL